MLSITYSQFPSLSIQSILTHEREQGHLFEDPLRIQLYFLAEVWKSSVMRTTTLRVRVGKSVGFCDRSMGKRRLSWGTFNYGQHFHFNRWLFEPLFRNARNTSATLFRNAFPQHFFGNEMRYMPNTCFSFVSNSVSEMFTLPSKMDSADTE